MKNIVLLILIVFTSFAYEGHLFAQGKSQYIKVQYGVLAKSLEYSEDTKDFPDDVKKSMSQAFSLINTMKTELTASLTDGYCWSTNNLSNDVSLKSYNMALIMFGNKKKYHISLNDNSVKKYFEAYGENIILKKEIKDYKWTLSNESKKIGNYVCYKATLTYEVENSAGIHKKEVTAFYAPQINYRFGPMGYCGLPGLILELTDDKITYTANKIDFLKFKPEIPKFPKSKLITKEGLEKMRKKAVENREW